LADAGEGPERGTGKKLAKLGRVFEQILKWSTPVAAWLALFLSGSTYYHTYYSSMVTNFKVTNFAVAAELNGNTLVNADGSLLVTITNPGNREVSIDRLVIFLMPGDFKTLADNQTPPCVEKRGNLILLADNESMITMLTGSSRTIEGQHLITVPVNFKVFNNDNAAANTVQGTVCLKVDGTSYENTSRSAYNPVGILEVTRNTRIPPLPLHFLHARGENVKDVQSLF